jgi:hypothetical protein
MKTTLYALSGASLIIAVIACIIAATNGSSETEKTVPALSAGVELLSSRMATLEKQLRDMTGTLEQLKASNERRAASRLKIDDTTPESVNEYLVSLNDAMYQLEALIDATGLKSIATNLAVDPSILKNLYDQQARRKRDQDYRTAMSEFNTAQHQADEEEYGEDLKKMYETTRFQRGGRGGRNRDQNMSREKAEAKRKTAVNDLIEQYPDSNAAGILIAETGMRAAMRGKIEDAEKYYNMMTESDSRSQIVTDRGTKALPAMQYYLAAQYIEAGRMQDAENLIYQLEQNDSDMISSGRGGRGRRGGTSYQTTQDAAKSLRKRMK